MSGILQIKKHKDKKIFLFFEKVIEEMIAIKYTVRLTGRDYETVLPLQDFDENNFINLLKKNNGLVLDRVVCHLKNGVNLHFERGGIHPKDSPFFDEIKITQGNPAANQVSQANVALIDINKLIADKLNYFSDIALPKEQMELQALHSQTLTKLEDVNLELIEESQKYRTKLNDDYNKKIKDSEQDFKSKKEDLDLELSRERDAISQREHELDERKKTLDDKDNTHARRTIRQDLLTKLEKTLSNIGLSKETGKKRWPIHILMIATIVILGALSSITMHDLLSAMDSNVTSFALELPSNVLLNTKLYLVIVILIKQLLLSGTMVAAGVFYVKWLNRWFEQHSKAEFELRQFTLDIERASWLVETSLEWIDVKGKTMPEHLSVVLSSNLFSNGAPKDDQDQPIDQLASALLGSSNKIKLGVGDSNVEIETKDLKKTKEPVKPR